MTTSHTYAQIDQKSLENVILLASPAKAGLGRIQKGLHTNSCHRLPAGAMHTPMILVRSFKMSQFSNRFFIISTLCFTAILGCNKDSDENGDSQFQGNQWETKIAPEYNLRPLLSTSDLDTLRAHMTSLAATPLGLTMTSALDGELENKCTPISQACAGCPAFSMPEDTSSWWSFDKSYFGSEVAAEGIEASHISSTFEALRTNVPCLYQDMGFTEADLAGLLFEIHLAGAEENQLASSSYYEAPYFYLRLMAYSGLDFDMAKSLMESETSNQTATEDNPRLKQVLQVLSYLTSIENTPDSLSAIEISQVEGETEPQVIVKAEFVGWGWCGTPMTEPNCQDRNSVHVVENNEVSTQEIEIAVGDLVRTKVDLADISKEGQSCMLMGEVLAVNDNGEDETTYDLKVIAETPNYIEMLESCQSLDGSDLNHDDQIALPLSDLQYLNCVDQDPSVIPDDLKDTNLTT